jgi:hypothetical protein
MRGFSFREWEEKFALTLGAHRTSEISLPATMSFMCASIPVRCDIGLYSNPAHHRVLA